MEISRDELRNEVIRLRDTKKIIDEQLSTKEAKLLAGAKQLKEFQKMSWESMREMDSAEKKEFFNENDDRINKLNSDTDYLKKLYRIKDHPYFGSIVFNNEPIYIGISSVKKDLDYYVNDWRAPICSMFYDSGLGHASYECPQGHEEGIITQKRQYQMTDGKLTNVFDTDLNIDDEVLQTVLSRTSSDKMKNIVNTIQEEQNKVIRDDKTDNIIVQGIAGSGKTSVALHRIAFLLYRLEYLTSSNVLIFSPNNVFTEYISEVLPELGEDNTLQTTYHEFASKYTEEYEKVESYSSFVERYYKGKRQDNDLIEYKLSDNIIKSLEEYVEYFTKSARFINDLEYKKQIITSHELNELLMERFDNKPLIERIKLIAEKINNRYFKGLETDEERILKNLYKLLNFKKDYKEIYLNYFESMYFKNYYHLDYRRNENTRGITDKMIRYEDVTPFIYLKCLLEGYPYQVYVREVIIDEAQDYTYLQFKILKTIFKNAHFTILGDVNQTVNPFYKYNNLNTLLHIFTKNSKFIELKNSYRSSPEIIEYANSILNLDHVSAIRKKVNLPVIKRDIKDLKHIGRDIKYLKQKYKSICIITKSIDEAKIIRDAYKDNYKNISVIDITTEKFNKQLVVAPAYGVKGLEFDSVIIINNFSNDKYLYYVAVTRAQHELIVYE